MASGFWDRLGRPVMALAPMANVTDAAFRRMFAECGKPDVFWTEFVSVEGLLSRGREKLLVDFWFSADEHPIVAQVFGSKPEQFEAVGPLIRDLGFDGIDINMGCPDRGVERQKAGAALIKDPERAKEIIRAAKRGAGGLPVSVKTRLGYAASEIETWVPALLEEGIAALTMHLRTRAEMSAVDAHWELAPRIVALRDAIAPQTLVLGNGGVMSLAEAHARVRETGVDGVMAATGVFGNPWFFSGKEPGLEERLRRMLRHTDLFEELFAGIKNFEVMKKHYKAYVSGFDGARELRAELMAARAAGGVRRITEAFIAGLGAAVE
ncbi:MAG TPA: tRNA-dihydrouridine synthase [Candidatus Paceibacterota bacterium]|nr:tRNA-dihydrouridine synthase [Candidatus Paceibacterota bacterium]